MFFFCFGGGKGCLLGGLLFWKETVVWSLIEQVLFYLFLVGLVWLGRKCSVAVLFLFFFFFETFYMTLLLLLLVCLLNIILFVLGFLLFFYYFYLFTFICLAYNYCCNYNCLEYIYKLKILFFFWVFFFVCFYYNNFFCLFFVFNIYFTYIVKVIENRN